VRRRAPLTGGTSAGRWGGTGAGGEGGGEEGRRPLGTEGGVGGGSAWGEGCDGPSWVPSPATRCPWTALDPSLGWLRGRGEPGGWRHAGVGGSRACPEDTAGSGWCGLWKGRRVG